MKHNSKKSSHHKSINLIQILSFLFFFSFVSGCGWKFKVLSDQLPVNKIYLSGIENGVGRELLSRLRRMDNLNIVNSAVDSEVVINLLVDNEKVVVGFSGAGRPRELELRTTVKIEINDQEGKPIQPLDKLQIIRSVNFSDTDVLATQSHEAFHRSDIEKQLAIRIIERLQRIAP
ncbi:MAG: hypothetical protein CBD16_08430 [Betaproteobacteria bacterium TMED156]|nr:MAG: hypothetical protein CBD16_08430 [Betaproteobacteria bacterium TMED156]